MGSITNAFNQINIRYDKKRMLFAIDNQDFKKRKKIYQENKDKEKFLFLRKGIEGDWIRFLTDSMLKAIKNKHGKVMREFGYDI